MKRRPFLSILVNFYGKILKYYKACISKIVGGNVNL